MGNYTQKVARGSLGYLQPSELYWCPDMGVVVVSLFFCYNEVAKK